MKVLTGIDETRAAIREIQRQGGIVGLVPTMGALHEGHLSLIRAARDRCTAVAVTIFVNPLQFGPKEDLDAYPRPMEADLSACRELGVEIVFAPPNETMYPAGAVTTVEVGGITEVLCGPCRPGHFQGVTTVVAKLFNILPADVAFFGEKDYQQLVVIEQMVRDLNIPIEIVRCPTIREADGLAMSSRNAYLSLEERQQAASLSRALFAAVDQIAAGLRDVDAVIAGIRQTILGAGPADIEYIDIVDAGTLENLETVDRTARICLAVEIGSCRLIDNVGVDAPSGGN
jgi:pantoate--beta-alanine ligase